MTETDNSSMMRRSDHPRKPRIAIMGEFSAGKSTLSNLLVGAPVLPVKVTPTRLPPVWIAQGEPSVFSEDLDENVTEIDIDRMASVALESTMFVRVFRQSEILAHCDLIDMPGISDPNMSPDVFQRALPYADAVLWCTHATQAWRQSEAAVWSSLSPELHARSLLLITRIDKLPTERDRQRVVRRVEYETRGLFAGLYPISLSEALASGDDRARWENSGAEAFADRFVELIHDLTQLLSNQAQSGPLAVADAGLTAPVQNPVAEAPAATEIQPCYGANVTPLKKRERPARAALDPPGVRSGPYPTAL